MTVDGSSWRVETYGVWDAQGQRWIQLSLTGQEGRSNLILTLKLAEGAGVRRAVMALSSWLASPADTRDILNVAWHC